MRIVFTKLILTAVIALSSLLALAQPCGYNGHEINDTISFYMDRTDAGPNYVAQEFTTDAGTAFPIYVCEGATYNFFTCGNGGSVINYWNTTVTIVADSSGLPSNTILAGDTAGSGGACTSPSRDDFDWISDRTGRLWVLYDTAGCKDYDRTTDTAAQSGRLRIRQETDADSLSDCATNTNVDTVFHTAAVSTEGCTHNYEDSYTCVGTTLSGEDKVYWIADLDTTGSGGLTAIQEFQFTVENCTSDGSDSIFFLIRDTAVASGSCLTGQCGVFEIFDLSTSSFLSTGVKSVIIDSDDLSTTSGSNGYYIHMDMPTAGSWAECDITFETIELLTRFEFDRDGDSATASAGNTFCGTDSNSDGNVWTVTFGGTGGTTKHASDTIVNAGDTVIVCDTMYIEVNNISGLDLVTIDMEAGWDVLSVVSPSGANSGQYDVSGSWTPTVTGNEITWSFTSSINSGNSGDYNVANWLANYRNDTATPEYNCIPYTFCWNALLLNGSTDGGTTNSAVGNDDVDVFIKQENFDSASGAVPTAGSASDFVLGTVFILPIFDMSIDASDGGAVNIVDWSIFTDQYVVAYELERSRDGLGWTGINNIPPLNGASRIYYQTVDYDPIEGHNYYRIKGTTDNGDVFYSDIAYVWRGEQIGQVANILKVYPNPTEGMLTIELDEDRFAQYSVRIFNLLGAEVLNYNFTAEGAHSEQLDLSRLPVGIYAIDISSDQQLSPQRMLIQRK